MTAQTTPPEMAPTARLTMRRFREEDAPFVLQLLNTPGWLQFIGDRGIRTEADAERYITERLVDSYNRFGFGMYQVQLKETGEPIGMCGLVKRDTLPHADLGYALLPQWEGRGYAFEAAAAVLRYAKEILHLNPVLAIVTPGNERSVALLQKLGFQMQQTIMQQNESLLLFRHDGTSLEAQGA